LWNPNPPNPFLPQDRRMISRQEPDFARLQERSGRDRLGDGGKPGRNILHGRSKVGPSNLGLALDVIPEMDSIHRVDPRTVPQKERVSMVTGYRSTI